MSVRKLAALLTKQSIVETQQQQKKFKKKNQVFFHNGKVSWGEGEQGMF